ncbi:MAG: chaperone modulator CbpM [Lautropia sp.]
MKNSSPERTASISITTISSGAAGSGHPLAATELARSCGASVDWIVELVEYGIIEGDRGGARDDWRFSGDDLHRALEARRLQRDFEVGLDAAALILDLQREVRRLKAVLTTHAIQPPARR